MIRLGNRNQKLEHDSHMTLFWLVNAYPMHLIFNFMISFLVVVLKSHFDFKTTTKYDIMKLKIRCMG